MAVKNGRRIAAPLSAPLSASTPVYGARPLPAAHGLCVGSNSRPSQGMGITSTTRLMS